MAEYTEQHAAEIHNGPNFEVKAEHLTDNFNALNSAILDRVSLTESANPQEIRSALTVDGPLTLNGAPYNFAGVPTVPSDPTTPNQVTDKHYVDNLFAQIAAPAGVAIHNSARPVWSSNTSVTYAGIQESNSTGLVNLAGPVVLQLSSNGLNGLDTGVLGGSQVYSVYAIAKPDGTGKGLIASLQSVKQGGAPSLPVGYSGGPIIQMPDFLCTDSGGHIRNFISPQKGEFFFLSPPTLYSATALTFGSWTNFSIPVTPDISIVKMEYFTVMTNVTALMSIVVSNGSGGLGSYTAGIGSGASNPPTTSQAIESFASVTQILNNTLSVSAQPDAASYGTASITIVWRGFQVASGV